MKQNKHMVLVTGILVLFLCGLTGIAFADLILFHNGDFLIGDANEMKNGDVILTADGVQKVFKSIQVKDIIFGATSPVSIPGASNAIADASILPITLDITHRKEMTNHDGRKFIVDCQDGFEIPFVNLYPKTYSFFNRRGSKLRAGLVNNTTQELNGATFRVFFYDNQDKLMVTKDFYILRLRPTTQTRRMRIFEVDMVDVPYERVRRMRVVERF